MSSVIAKQTPAPLRLTELAPNSSASILVNGTAVGGYSTDGSGILQTSITLPSSLPPGIAMISVTGVNASQEPIEVQKVIYVAVTEEDIDGDSIPNIEERCLVHEAPAIDIDKDAIDDACDGYIGEPPISVYSQNTPSTPEPTTIRTASNSASRLSLPQRLANATEHEVAHSLRVESWAATQVLGVTEQIPALNQTVNRKQSSRRWLLFVPAIPLLVTLLYLTARNIRRKRLQ